MRFMAADVARATGGDLVGQNAHLAGLAFDSRVIRPGQLFVPIIAERDGHDYIDDALQAGAGAYLTSRPTQGRTAIVVPDTLGALLQLGTWARNKLNSQLANRVIAITGSVGKTSTKDFIAAALGSQFRVSASERSFNNDQGLPTTILNARDDVECLVLEMGMRGFGEIRRLCEIARPVIGVVTCVAEAHTERVGGIDGVARAKSELPESLDASGSAVLCADDDRVLAMSKHTQASVVTYGESIDADVRIESWQMNDQGLATVQLKTPWGKCEYVLGVPGRHMALNAAAAIAVAGVLGADIQIAASALESASMSPMRMQMLRLTNGALVLNDAYNANPISMRAALMTLGEISARRRIAVLGLMAELACPQEQHLLIAALAREQAIDLIAIDTPLYGIPSRTIDEALARLGGLGDGDVVVVKGSRVAQLERLVERLVGHLDN